LRPLSFNDTSPTEASLAKAPRKSLRAKVRREPSQTIRERKTW
jgi:hypothetical protein